MGRARDRRVTWLLLLALPGGAVLVAAVLLGRAWAKWKP
jgi:hypothetical protein